MENGSREGGRGGRVNEEGEGKSVVGRGRRGE